ncbi:MAG TPA: CBS domain-containing protein, partial [Anaerolineales bacterium]|nr:CBS domain-containing protein [Anaerolineales bacterium]
MHIILTHEQADFDALASLLGAYFLDESAIPVLPRRMNRNVSAFLTLYGADLPFIDPRDLGGQPIEAVTLVDTQSMVSIKGMVSQPKVRVIDHHPRRENLPAEWQVTTFDLGATTTLLVEALREHNGPLSLVEATLLLLGIYEDTGSLTYSRTTPRDLRAAAFLVEQGASLQLASDFLNLPLSAEQQALYDRLRDQAEHYHIHGHTIVVAGGDAQDVDAELSSIAHKIRDLLDPDALFMVVQTRGGVQMIARSTSDQIDVAEITAHFGGGGHERAAAALIRDGRRSAVQAELVGLLPDVVHPAITVAQIMSRGPQLLTPETPVEEAARRMRRYGYEGYPVVKDEKVVGLLTRRAVDRALAHKLNLTAASLMDAGEFTVTPASSVEELQRLMTDSGWGQIPVVSPENDKIIGIVTRTDLLNTLTPHQHLPRYHKQVNRLEAALPLARLALLRCTAQLAYERRLALYIVGGFVRDLMLGQPSQDFDLVVEGDAIALTRALADLYGGRVTSHARFGTAKWHIGAIKTELTNRLLAEEAAADLLSSARPVHAADLPDSLDLVSARTEFYTHPSALPTVERGSIKLDLHRRDFTINTLALRLDGHHYGELYDYWGGLNDLRQGLVRVLHSLSFVDDPTRLLRAVRFEQRFFFRIGPRTLVLMLEARSLLDRVSGD